MKSFTFNKVYIIRSLDPGKKEYWTPGDVLLKEMINEGVPCEIKDVLHGFANFVEVTTSIYTECTSDGIRPIIHFICHGLGPNQLPQYNDGALAIWNNDTQKNELIQWEYVFYLLAPINKASHFNLFITMSVCHGFYSAIKILDPNYRIPFCGILASPDSVMVNSSMEYFKAFYLSLIHNKDVYVAIKQLLNNLMTFKDEYEKLGIDFERQLVVFSDILFTNAAKEDYQQNRSNNAKLRRTAIQAYHDAEGITPSEGQIRAFVGLHPILFWKEFSKMRDSKFMLDVYPENKKILELPYSFNELKR